MALPAHALKLSVTEPGPRPLVSVVRYPVLNGVKGKRVQIPLPIMMHNNTPYHVALDVKGTRFRAFVEDQEVDSWNDDRLRAGGVVREASNAESCPPGARTAQAGGRTRGSKGRGGEL